MKNRRSLVTGGGGFIGAHLVRQLLEQGETVRVLDLHDVPLPSSVEVVRGSVCDASVVRDALDDVQRLYHLAGNPNLWTVDKKDFQRVNYEGTCTVFEEAARKDLEVVVHTSTESILTGSAEINAPVDSDVQRVLKEMPGPYCRSKFLAEQAAFQAARDGLPVVIVAPTLPIGPGDRMITPPTRMILDFLNVRTPAFYNCRFNLVDVRDIAKGHILAAEYGRPGERYILGHENVTLDELLQMLEEITGLSMPKLQVPYWVALSAGVISEFTSDFITHRPPKAPLTGVRLAKHPMHFNSDKAINELGLPQSSLHQALTDEVQWLINEGLVKRDIPLRQET